MGMQPMPEIGKTTESAEPQHSLSQLAPFSTNKWLQRMTFHELLLGYAIYPLMLCTGLSLALLASRFYLAKSVDYRFLIWNLLLAWIPYGCAVWALWLERRCIGSIWRLFIPAFLWLIFLPNAPYIVTDFVHLNKVQQLTLWYDIGLLTAFAWSGCFLGVISLQIMQHVVSVRFGRWISWVFVLIVAGLTGMGVYLGRFLRFNSWDLFTQPGKVLEHLFEVISNPLAHQNQRAVGVTLMFAALTLLCHITFTAGRSSPFHGAESTAQ
jgi:uncharacterized membrane protein